MRLLFVKPSLGYPRADGQDVYCYAMMKALAGLGADVALATAAPINPRAVDGLRLSSQSSLADVPLDGAPPLALSRLQERFRSYWGVNANHVRALRVLVDRFRPDVVVAFGLNALPYLGGAGSAVHIWGMLDEWMYHHLSQIQLRDRSTWHHLKTALVKGLYERAYGSIVDGVWTVSDTDQRAARWLAGMRAVLAPNGVDGTYFAPRARPVTPTSAVFWGRLDFEPNIDALLWFNRYVWPVVLAREPQARVTIIGYAPVPAVQRLAAERNVTLLPNVDDLRDAVCEHALVVLPIISGGGIKNKLLEAAAMGRPIVATPRACLDLKSDGALPVAMAGEPDAFAGQMLRLWQAPAERDALGARAREWVGRHYTWDASARVIYADLERVLSTRAKSAS